jgi:hypothetical protein
MVYNARLVHRLDMLVVVKFGRIDYVVLEDSMRSCGHGGMGWDGMVNESYNAIDVPFRLAMRKSTVSYFLPWYNQNT